MSASIREKQIAALQRMLNFNVAPTKSSLSEPHWKVLVYDRWGQDIISPLLSVKELRDLGVTLHSLIHSDREALPDVPAIYFVMPSDDNIKRISQDMESDLYEQYYLNFISAINRDRLEDLASAAIHAQTVTSITKVMDQYLNFISLEDDMFVLRDQNSHEISYYSMNRSDLKDTEAEEILDSSVPIIRAPRSNAAEIVAEKLDKKLRDNLLDARNSLFTSDSPQAGQFSFQRPLLVVLDRNQDLATPFHHTWTYQALAHDVLSLKLNRVELEVTSEQTPARVKKEKKQYDLNQSDHFWQSHKGSPFPTVAEAVQGELDSYRSQEDEIKRLKSAMGIEGEVDENAMNMLSDNTARLTSAVSSLPELLQKKKHIDMHTNIATACLDQIKSRKLDVYFETEEKLMSRSSLDRSLLEIIKDPDAGLSEDRLRLFIISLLCGQQLPDNEIEEYRAALQEAGCDLSAVNYIRRWKTHARLSAPSSAYTGGGTKTVGMFNKLMSHASTFAMEGVKNLVVKKHNLPVTRIVDAFMEQKSQPDTDDYRYFDPKLLRQTDNNALARSKAAFQEAFVFVVGSGNYVEYQNLSEYAKGKGGAARRITYGCSELLNARQFLQQISELGKEL